jgi:hypothetical protein
MFMLCNFSRTFWKAQFGATAKDPPKPTLQHLECSPEPPHGIIQQATAPTRAHLALHYRLPTEAIPPQCFSSTTRTSSSSRCCETASMGTTYPAASAQQVANGAQRTCSEHRPGRLRFRRRHIPYLHAGEQVQDTSVTAHQVLPGTSPVWRAVNTRARVRRVHC